MSLKRKKHISSIVLLRKQNSAKQVKTFSLKQAANRPRIIVGNYSLKKTLQNIQIRIPKW